MLRWKLKACPRCRGDLFVDKDQDNWYEQCLQCGDRSELKYWISPKSQEFRNLGPVYSWRRDVAGVDGG